jgi:trimethylamine corrinoid protein
MHDLDEAQVTLSKLLLSVDIKECSEWVKGVINTDISPLEFFNQVFTPAMAAVGDKFGRLEIFLPELMDAAEKAKAISEEVIKPALAASGTSGGESRGMVVICSVQGDLHDIGKNMVSLMLQVNGFDVIDLGVNVPVREALNRARDEGADILGLSSLMTTSMPYMKECVQLRDGLGLRERFHIIVGGAPITLEYCEDIGADAFGRDAIDAVEKCFFLLGQGA